MSLASSSPAGLLNTSFALPRGPALANRIVKSAMSEALAGRDGLVNDALITLYRRWAEGGAGLLVTGNVMIDRAALGEPGNVVIARETVGDAPDSPGRKALAAWATAATSGGNAAWVQLNHPGKQAIKGLNRENVAPSAVPFRADMQALFPTPRALGEGEIEVLIERFAFAAAACRDAGFTGVQLHGAHGYLISQFLSPHHNIRTDRWGGSPAARRRFVLEVLAAVRAAVGPAFPVGIKLNSADFQRGGFTEAESLETVQALAEAGIDLVEISGGTYEAPAMTGLVRQSTAAREAYFLDFAAKVRDSVRVPLMVTGGFRSASGMAAAIESGAVDLVGLARVMALDPLAPRRLLAGQPTTHQVRPVKTGIGRIDRTGIMEIMWYTEQLRQLGRGREPDPRTHPLWLFIRANARMMLRGRQGAKRLRAS